MRLLLLPIYLFPLISKSCEYLNSLNVDDQFSVPMGRCLKQDSATAYTFDCYNDTNLEIKVYSSSICDDDAEVPQTIYYPTTAFETSCDGIGCNYALWTWYAMDDPNSNTCDRPNITENTIPSIYRPYALDLCLRVGDGVRYSTPYRMMTCDYMTNTVTTTGYNDSECTQQLSIESASNPSCSDGYWQDWECFNMEDPINRISTTATVMDTTEMDIQGSTTAPGPIKCSESLSVHGLTLKLYIDFTYRMIGSHRHWMWR